MMISRFLLEEIPKRDRTGRREGLEGRENGMLDAIHRGRTWTGQTMKVPRVTMA
jgi:hypothetical protein